MPTRLHTRIGASGPRPGLIEPLGSADIERGVSLRVDSAHRLASLSKPVTGMIVMDLVQSGRLKLDSPIKVYLRDLPAPYDHVTARRLLSHQGGFPIGYALAVASFNRLAHLPTGWVFGHRGFAAGR